MFKSRISNFHRNVVLSTSGSFPLHVSIKKNIADTCVREEKIYPCLKI